LCMMPIVERGIRTWPAAMLVWGPGFATRPHRHHAVQLLMSLRGSLQVRAGRQKDWRRCSAVWIRPDALHEMDARGSTLLILFVSTESTAGNAVARRLTDDVARVPGRLVARWRTALSLTPTEIRAERWLASLLPPASRAAAIHPGVQRALRYLKEPRAEFDGLSLPALAAIAGLSPSRFMHAFTRSVGVPLRPYILWLRLQRAACDLMNGASITAAAHRAGFADAAHLTRTFRRMLGATPSELRLQTRSGVGVSDAD
jgi:AraC-like DNA-binding protein